MKKIIALLGCVATAFLSAETVDKISFQFPEYAQEWKLLNTFDYPTFGQLYIYGQEESQEDLRVIVDAHGAMPKDQAAFEKGCEAGLTLFHPDGEIETNILDKDGDSYIREMIIKKDGMIQEYQLARIFCLDGKTIYLSYQTANRADLDATRSLWLQILKQAHPID